MASSRVHYPALDGLRGVAILLVVFYHNFDFSEYFFFGWLGVDLFFVLSGYLITDILIKTVHAKNYFKNFYAKRILRIFPLYFLSLIILLLILPLIKNFPLDLSVYADNQWWFWTYLQNWFLIFKNVSHPNYAMHHYWSLAVEEQFYIIWPFVIYFFKKPKPLLIITGLILTGVIITRFSLWTFQIKDFNYFGLYTYTRIDGICIGSMLALLQFMKSAFIKKYFTGIILVLALINFLFFFFNRSNQFSFPFLAVVGYTTFAALFALLIHEIVINESRLFNGLLKFSPLRFMGKISYGLYILHWPVYLIFFDSLSEWTGLALGLTGKMQNIFVAITLTLAGIILSILSFYLFERHFLKLKKKFT